MSLSHEAGREDNHSVSTVLPQDPYQALVVTWEPLRVGSSIFPLQGYGALALIWDLLWWFPHWVGQSTKKKGDS